MMIDQEMGLMIPRPFPSIAGKAQFLWTPALLGAPCTPALYSTLPALTKAGGASVAWGCKKGLTETFQRLRVGLR